MLPNFGSQFFGIKEWHPVFGSPNEMNIDLYKWHLKYE
jgi:hypothetical protein